jgi:hypothetical protein
MMPKPAIAAMPVGVSLAKRRIVFSPIRTWTIAEIRKPKTRP